jgi:hypothetical protein
MLLLLSHLLLQQLVQLKVIASQLHRVLLYLDVREVVLQRSAIIFYRIQSPTKALMVVMPLVLSIVNQRIGGKERKR